MLSWGMPFSVLWAFTCSTDSSEVVCHETWLWTVTLNYMPTQYSRYGRTASSGPASPMLLCSVLLASLQPSCCSAPAPACPSRLNRFHPAILFPFFCFRLSQPGSLLSWLPFFTWLSSTLVCIPRYFQGQLLLQERQSRRRGDRGERHGCRRILLACSLLLAACHAARLVDHSTTDRPLSHGYAFGSSAGCFGVSKD